MKKILVALLIFTIAPTIANATSVITDKSNIDANYNGAEWQGIFQYFPIENAYNQVLGIYDQNALYDGLNSVTSVKVWLYATQGAIDNGAVVNVGAFESAADTGNGYIQGVTPIGTSDSVNIGSYTPNTCTETTFFFDPLFPSGSDFAFEVKSVNYAPTDVDFVALCGENTGGNNDIFLVLYDVDTASQSGYLNTVWRAPFITYGTLFVEPDEGFLRFNSALNFATSTANGVASNIPNVLAILGLTGAVPVLFFVARRITGLF